MGEPFPHTTPFKRGVSLTYKVAAAIILLIVCIMGAVTAVVRDQVRTTLIKQMMNKGQVLARGLAGNAVEAVVTDEHVRLAMLVDQAKKQEADIFAAAIVDPEGQVMAHSDYRLERKAYPRPAGVRPRPLGTERLSEYVVHGEEVLDFESDMIIANPEAQASKSLGKAHVLYSLGPIQTIVTRTQQNIFYIALCGLGLGILVSIWVVARITRPVQELAQAAETIGAGHLDLRIPVKRRDELGQLSATFNHMAENLKRAQAELIVKERLQHEMEIAQRIQNMLVPKTAPAIRGFSVGMLYRAAEEVSGDYFDFLDLGKGSWGMTVADVSGKGVPGALVMAQTRSVLRSIGLSSRSPGEVLSKTNLHLHKDLPESMFVTMTYVVLDAGKRTLSIARAGHLAALIYRKASGECEFEMPAGIAIGISDPEIFESMLAEKTIRLNPGDVVVLYTDGLEEATNAAKELFGSPRLIACVKNAADQKAPAIVEALDNAVKDFVGPAPQHDDITMILLKVDERGDA